MPYFRIDMDGADGEHLGIFAESDAQGVILQQFGIAIDAGIADLEHCKLSTVADVMGRPLSRIDPELGWFRITPEEYELAVETKRRIALRDNTEARKVRPPCGHCAGLGKTARQNSLCPFCMGTGKL